MEVIYAALLPKRSRQLGGRERFGVPTKRSGRELGRLVSEQPGRSASLDAGGAMKFSRACAGCSCQFLKGRYGFGGGKFTLGKLRSGADRFREHLERDVSIRGNIDCGRE